MKLSFSTRGWQNLVWDEIVEAAIESEFNGIELYDVQKVPALIEKTGPLHKYNATATYRFLKEKGIEIPCIDSSCDLANEQEDCVETISSLTDIAKSVHAHYVGVVVLSENDSVVRERLDKLVAIAEEKNITILIKTSGVYADTSRLRDLLESYACDQLGALWDVHHPYRDFGESADTTIKNLGAYVKHVHLRDSDDKETYNLIGEGNLPVDEFMRALTSINYNGMISLEWKTEWLEDLSDKSIIFPHFVNYMHRYETTNNKKRLYPNHDGTGQYIWKKEELIDMTFSQVLDKVAEEFPDQYAFKYTTLDYIRTYSEFREDVDKFARALVSMGVKAGSKVAIWATNVPAWYITFWATTKIGAILVTVNTAYKIHEAEYLLRQSDTHTLVMIESALDSNYKNIINEI